MKTSWLLLKKSGKQSLGRLVLTAVAVALGMLMILIFMSGLNALNERYSGTRNLALSLMEGGSAGPIDGVDPLLVRFSDDGSLLSWRDRDIFTVTIGATGDSSPRIFDLETPGSGEFYVSSGLDEIIRNNPDDNPGVRFGNKQIGIIPDRYSTSPDELMVIRGMSEEEILTTEGFADTDGFWEIYSFAPSENTQILAITAGVTNVVLFGGATILLFPIISFIAVATQLGSAQREKRYAAMRLVGATRAQITRAMALESLVAAIAGIIVGSLAYLVALPFMANYHFDGARFWMEDLTVPLNWYLIAVVVTLLFCWFANWWGMRHVRTSPLGVVRAQRISRKPRIWCLLPLAAGLGFFVWMASPTGNEWIIERASEDPAISLIMIAAIFVTMFGLVLAGSWLTYYFSKLFARITKKAAVLLATKRISIQAKRIFRSVGGVVLALFAGSFYLTVVSGMGELYTATLNFNGFSQLRPDIAYVYSAPRVDLISDQMTAKLADQPFIKSVTPTAKLIDGSNILTCADLVVYTKRNCPASFRSDDLVSIKFRAPVVDDSAIGLVDDEVFELNDYLIMLDSSESLDKLRTFFVQEIGFGSEIDSQAGVVSGADEQTAQFSPVVAELSSLVYVGIAITLFVAIASLVVSTVGGLLERKRSLTTLRLGGMTISQMKRMVMIESLIPLIVVSLVAAGLGGWIGAVFITTFSSTLVPTLSPLYFVIIIGSLVAAIVGIYCVLPILSRITDLRENRGE